MKTKKKILSAKSFTLAELMLIAVFLTVIFAGLLTSFIACILLNEISRNLSIAATHAQYIMEEIKDSASTINGFNNLRTTGAGQWNLSATSDFQNRDLFYLTNEAITVTVSDASTGEAPTATSELLDVLVTVNWTDRSRNKSMPLETLITEP
ncbi:MAG: hypothetical protein PHP17_00320 [Candidatus Omnitrophica bacterium]|nr:hypothetical protein [Candidatus Omnitrophota bacterium]